MVVFVPSGSLERDRARLARASSSAEWIVLGSPDVAERLIRGGRAAWCPIPEVSVGPIWPEPRLRRSLELRDVLERLVQEFPFTELRFPAHEALSWATGLQMRQGGRLKDCRLTVEVDRADETLATSSTGCSIQEQLMRDAGRMALRNADVVEGDSQTIATLQRQGLALGTARNSPSWSPGQTPRITAVVAHRNLSRTIPACLASLRAQTLPVEVVVVDDGSDTENLHALKREAASDPALKLICQGHAGPGVARNRGAEAASGELLVFVDADNTVRPQFVERLSEALRWEPGASFATSAFQRHTADGSPADVMVPLIASPSAQFVLNAYGDTCSMHRRASFLAVGGFCEEVELSEDWELWLRYLSAGMSGTTVPELLFDFNLRPGSRMHRRTRLDWLRNKARMAEIHRDLVSAHASEVAVLMATHFKRELDALRGLCQAGEDQRNKLEDELSVAAAKLRALEGSRADHLAKANTLEQEIQTLHQTANTREQEIQTLHQTLSFRTADAIHRFMPRAHRLISSLLRRVLAETV